MLIVGHELEVLRGNFGDGKAFGVGDGHLVEYVDHVLIAGSGGGFNEYIHALDLRVLFKEYFANAVAVKICYGYLGLCGTPDTSTRGFSHRVSR